MSGLVLVLILAGLGVWVRPLTALNGAAVAPAAEAALGGILGLLAMALQASVSRLQFRTLAGGLAGATLGAWAASLLWWAGPATLTQVSGLRWLTILALVHAGAAVGGLKASGFHLSRLRDMWDEHPQRSAPRVLDTSVIIDGRINDVIESGFLDGRIMVAQFILRELQQVADSPDPLKRARGRKGLESLQALKKYATVQVEVTALDFPDIREVDLKLIELARRVGGKIVTNDLNLNKVARVRDIQVLNINDLANALRPVVLPGEPMRVFILKEGKEPNQGIAYLDDGTMVVVDDGKILVGQTVDIVITSVLQTTAGKMFFGRCEAAATARRETV